MSEIPHSEKAEIAFIEIHPGVAAVIGDKPVAGLETLNLDLLSGEAKSNLSSSIAQLTAVAGLAKSISASHTDLQGLVRLTPKSIADLQKFVPMAVKNSTANYGVLLNGKDIATLLQWEYLDPKTIAALTGRPEIMIAAAIAALALQLDSIEKKVDENIELTRQAINEIRQATQEDRWSSLISLDQSVSKAVLEARHTEEVSNHVFAPLQGKETDIIKSRELFTRNVQKHLNGLEAGGEERQKYLTENSNAILNDAYGLLLAEWTRHRWNVLRAANISLDSGAEKLLSNVLETTEQEYEASRKKLEKLLRRLVSQLNLMKVLADESSSSLRGRLPFGGNKESKSIAQQAEQLAQSVASLSGREFELPVQPKPQLEVFKSDQQDNLYRILQWVLPIEEKLLVLADVNQGMKNSYLGVTDKNFFITGYGDLKKDGTNKIVQPLENIRYVRLDETEKSSPELHIITRDENYMVTFDRWIQSDHQCASARELADVLATAMNLPEAEKKTNPILASCISDSKEVTR